MFLAVSEPEASAEGTCFPALGRSGALYKEHDFNPELVRTCGGDEASGLCRRDCIAVRKISEGRRG